MAEADKVERLAEAQIEKVVEKVEVRYREFRGPLRWVVTGFSVILIAYLLAYLLGFLTGQKVFLYMPQFRAMGLAITFILAYLLTPPRRTSRKDRLPWYDIVLMLFGVVPSLYYFFIIPRMVGIIKVQGGYEIVLGILLFISLLEATRRLMGPVVTGITALFIIYPMVSARAPGFLQSRGFPADDTVARFYLFDSTGVFGSFLDIALGIFFIFILFGVFLRLTGATEFFTNLALSIMGHVRGGPAKVVLIADIPIGTMTGSAIANVVASGVVTIPLMKKTGYKAHFAAAVEAVSSTGGQLVPPVMGVTAFIMAEVLNMSYWKIAIAAIVPSVLYYLALYFMVDFEAAKTGLAGRPRAELPKFWRVLAQGGYFFLPVVVLVYFLGKLAYSPEKAALYATITIMLLSYIRRQTWLTPRKILRGVEDTARSMLEVTIMCAAITIISGSVGMTGMGVNLAGGLVELSQGSMLLLLILTAIVCYILGMGLPTMAAYLMLALLVGPALVKQGMLPLVAHFFIFYWSLTSHITPPVAPAAYVAAGLAGASMWRTGWTAMRLGIVLLILPFFFVYSPALLMQGPPLLIVQRGVASAIGALGLASALQGYFFDNTRLWQRVAMGAGGILLISPGWETDLIGLALFGLPLLWHWREARVARRKRLAMALPVPSVME